ncbi:ATP-binding protein [Streptomyces sp. NPDC059398]|uniref:ATP-binding protein n=1 Tax=Streptomyces sp. NPDC059398 TaxID=3346820 RepID=UPI003687DE04
MPDTDPDRDDNTPPDNTPTGHTSAPGRPGGTHRIDIGGSVTGSVIAGNHNVVVDAQQGSQVTVLLGPERPRPERRERAEVLPRSLPEPVGREEAARALAAAVLAGGPVQLWGPPGVGKTTLLRHAARLLPPGPDGTVFLGGADRDIEDLAQDVFEACYEAPGYAPNRAELRRLMAGVRVTVYVDDADLTSDQLLELMDLAPQAAFVFASAERTLWSGGTALELCGLSETDGLALLERELGVPLPDADRETAASLCRAAGGLPLPLLRAAAVARSGPEGGVRLPRVGEVADLLPALLGRLAGDEPVMAVLHLLATFDGAEVAAVHVGALTEVAEPGAVCDRLVGLGLARLGEYGYASVADTVPVVRQRFAAPFPADRLCDHFTRWAALRETTPQELAAHGGVLAKVAEVAESAGRPDLAVRLARATSPGLARSLRFGAWGRLLGRGWVASRAAGDRQAEAYFLHEEAVRALLTGKRVVYAALLAHAAWLGHELAAGAGSGAGAGAGAGGGVGGAGVGAGGAGGGAGAGGGVGGAGGGVGAGAGAGAHGSGAAAGVGGHAGGAAGGVGAHAGGGPPSFDVHHYMGQHGFGSAHSGASAGHGALAQPSVGSGGGSWGGAPGHGAASAAPGHGGTTAASGHGGGTASGLTGHGGASGATAHAAGAGGGSWGGATTASSGATTATTAATTTAAAGAAGAGMSTLAVTIVSLVAACALVAGVGYAVSSPSSPHGQSRSGDARNGALPIPSFSLPSELTDTSTPTADPFARPAGCKEETDAKQRYSGTMAKAPVTNPGADEAWAASTEQLSKDLAAASELATDSSVKSALQKESSDEASLSRAITRHDQAALDQYVDATGDDDSAVTDLCYS